jgi:hypothetical protein
MSRPQSSRADYRVTSTSATDAQIVVEQPRMNMLVGSFPRIVRRRTVCRRPRLLIHALRADTFVAQHVGRQIRCAWLSVTDRGLPRALEIGLRDQTVLCLNGNRQASPKRYKNRRDGVSRGEAKDRATEQQSDLHFDGS